MSRLSFVRQLALGRAAVWTRVELENGCGVRSGSNSNTHQEMEETAERCSGGGDGGELEKVENVVRECSYCADICMLLWKIK